MSAKSTESESTSDLLSIYALMVEMADRVSQRRQAANSFYLTVNTALIGGAAYLNSQVNPNRALWVLGLAGIAICALWIRNIESYRTLNNAKFKVIHELEERLPAAPYTSEWSHLTEPEGKRHHAFHKTEILVPIVFIGVHLVQAALCFPWHFAIALTRRSLSAFGVHL
jgi:hypothetical protein